MLVSAGIVGAAAMVIVAPFLTPCETLIASRSTQSFTLCAPTTETGDIAGLAAVEDTLRRRLIAALKPRPASVQQEGDGCFQFTIPVLADRGAIIQDVTRPSYVALADSDGEAFQPGTRVTLVCPPSNRSCAPDADVGTTNVGAHPYPILQVVVQASELQPGGAHVIRTSDGLIAVKYALEGAGIADWCVYTTHHIERFSALVLDGKVVSDPQISGPICGGQTQMTGLGDAQARQVAAALNYGSYARGRRFLALAGNSQEPSGVLGSPIHTIAYAAAGYQPKSDGTLAVGPTSMLVAVNSALALYTKSGKSLAAPTSFNTFFGVSHQIVDARALYDAGNAAAGGYGGGDGRFIILALRASREGGTGTFLLAVSRTHSPSGLSTGPSAPRSWCRYVWSSVVRGFLLSTEADFPALGVDGNNLYVTSNQFDIGIHTEQYSRLLVIPKTKIYPDARTGACPSPTGSEHAPAAIPSLLDADQLKNPDGSPAFSVQPANQPDAHPTRSATTMYLLNSKGGGGSAIALRKVAVSGRSATLGSPSWVQVPRYTAPISSPQPGTFKRIDTGFSARLNNAVDRYGSLYTALATGPSGVVDAAASVRWYQIAADRLTAATHTIASDSVNFFYPGIAVGCRIGAAACQSPFVALQVTGAGATDPPSPYAVFGDNPPQKYERSLPGFIAGGLSCPGGDPIHICWGDYPGIASDPTSSSTVWMEGEYAPSPTAWGTSLISMTTR